MSRTRILALTWLGLALTLPGSAWAFCGFYVGRADAELFNEASQVVLVRDGNRTVITMASDYKGELTEFALVVPVPTFLERDQIHVANMALIDHLDAYSAPRLVEYFDEDPCMVAVREMALRSDMAAAAPMAKDEDKKLGVTIEATYTVGEYDILILSAKESDGLETWLTGNGYRIPKGASRVLDSYIKQHMRFFVARVNLAEQSRLGFESLRPIQVAFESSKFMLPLRLGTVNARGPQDLIVYALTRTGRVECVNYRTVELPSGMEVPVYVKDVFPDFYRDMFSRQVDKENRRAVFLEYAWNMTWCDPCAADPLSRDELSDLGVFWLDGSDGGPVDAYITRLHVRYDGDHFPDDLVFQETGNTENFQGRYVLRHPWTGHTGCPMAEQYAKQLRDRQEQEAQTLASLTGWDLGEIWEKVGLYGKPGEDPWWRKLWKN